MYTHKQKNRSSFLRKWIHNNNSVIEENETLFIFKFTYILFGQIHHHTFFLSKLRPLLFLLWAPSTGTAWSLSTSCCSTSCCPSSSPSWLQYPHPQCCLQLHLNYTDFIPVVIFFHWASSCFFNLITSDFFICI